MPVPKITTPSEPNHYMPDALTSHLMKTFERLVLDDTVIFLLHRAFSLLEKAGSIVRVIFFDFSSASCCSCWVYITDNNEDEYRELIMNFVDWC